MKLYINKFIKFKLIKSGIMAIVYSSKKSHLTEKQIEEICNSIPVNKSLPEYVGKSIINKIRTRLFNELSNVSIYPEMFLSLKMK